MLPSFTNIEKDLFKIIEEQDKEIRRLNETLEASKIIGSILAFAAVILAVLLL